jgi:hypothetical protein
MCHFISLVTSGIAANQVDGVLRNNGRRAILANVKSLQNEIKNGELQFFTCIGECDCGTALAHNIPKAAFDPIEQLRKFRAKGWTQQKAERAVKAKQESESKSQIEPADSYELWQKIISDLLALEGCKKAGLMLHFYTGSVTTEDFHCIRKNVKSASIKNELAKIPENTLLMVSI